MRSQALDTLRLQLLPLFHTDEDAKSISSRTSVAPKSLRKWWTEEFGKEAVSLRGKKVLLKVNQSRGYVFGEPKKCPLCKTVKTNFRPSSKNPNRPRPWCSDCEAEESARYRATRTPEQRLERAAYTKVTNTKYYAEHAEESREYSRQYRESHPGVGNAKNKVYFRAYPEKLLLCNAKQRARRFGLPFTITVEDVLKCIPQDGRCPITMELFEKGEGKLCSQSISLDRIIPALGYVPGNIGVLSYAANRMKQNCVNSEVFRRMAVWLDDPRPHEQEFSTLPMVPRYLLKGIKQRARRDGIPFNITREDIQALVPSDGLCPITRQPFVRGVGKVGPQSMSLDRINPKLGYVRGNVAVISFLANSIKQSCTDPSVFRRLADYLEKVRSI